MIIGLLMIVIVGQVLILSDQISFKKWAFLRLEHMAKDVEAILEDKETV